MGELCCLTATSIMFASSVLTPCNQALVFGHLPCNFAVLSASCCLLCSCKVSVSRLPLDPAAAAQSLMAAALCAAGNPRNNLGESVLEALFGMCT